MIKSIQRLGHETLEFSQLIGRAAIFLLLTLVRRPRPFRSSRWLIQEMYFIGVLSLPIILVSSAFIGMVVALQGYNVLVKFSAEIQLGQLLALSVVRELGPVVAGLLFAGRAGSAVTAEISLMKTTEQLASMEMMGVDPLGRIISPRFWAGFISMPLLAMIFSVIAIYSGYYVAAYWLGIDTGAFWSNMQAAVDFTIDIKSSLIKSIVFGFAVMWVAVYQGYASVPTAEGIGRATTKTVVYASLLILGLDFVLTTLMLEVW